jgi:hypothetical protein
MHPSIVPTSQIFGVTTSLYEKAIAGLDRDTLVRRPGEGCNPLLWIAGHLASSRYGLAALLGVQRQNPLGKVFFRGVALGDLSALPDIGPIQEAWREASALVMSRLEELTESELSAPSPRPFPVSDGSIRGAITFLAYHEGYHVGQMSYLRRWLGLPGLVDG